MPGEFTDNPRSLAALMHELSLWISRIPPLSEDLLGGPGAGGLLHAESPVMVDQTIASLRLRPELFPEVAPAIVEQTADQQRLADQYSTLSRIFVCLAELCSKRHIHHQIKAVTLAKEILVGTVAGYKHQHLMKGYDHKRRILLLSGALHVLFHGRYSFMSALKKRKKKSGQNKDPAQKTKPQTKDRRREALYKTLSKVLS